MILINSAKFIVSDLQADFGKIPAAFVPIGGERLYVSQASALKKSFPGERIYLSLPIEYPIPTTDQECLKNLEITVIQNLSKISLIESMQCSLKEISDLDDSIRVLHGDTSFSEFPLEIDLIGVSEPKSEQNWFSEQTALNRRIVWSGYFAFSDYELLKASLDKEHNFETAVLLYDKKIIMHRNLMPSWQDLGHAATYYLARQNRLVTRAFNRLHYKNGVLEKSGDIHKINAEVNWYQSVPLQIRKYAPQLLRVNQNNNFSSYSIEYLPIPALSEILVFGNQPTLFWEKIFSLIEEFIVDCRNSDTLEYVSPNDGDFITVFASHVTKRLAFLDESECQIKQDDEIVVNGKTAVSIREVATACLEIIGGGRVIPSIVHGDLCLGNVLFESRMNQIRIIDPRGLDFEDSETIYGDQRYDIAKLAHSIIGCYDHIIANHFRLEHELINEKMKIIFEVKRPETFESIERVFYEKFLRNQKYQDDVLAIVILLFITMTPLHSENPERQLAFLSNSVMLYDRFFGRNT